MVGGGGGGGGTFPHILVPPPPGKHFHFGEKHTNIPWSPPPDKTAIAQLWMNREKTGENYLTNQLVEFFFFRIDLV